MKIDLHAHIVPRDCFNMVDSQGNKVGPTIIKNPKGQDIMMVGESSQGPIVPQISDPEIRIRDMDKIKLDMQAISITPTSLFYDLDPAEGLRLAQKQNNSIAQIVTAYPERFLGIAGLPLQDIGLSLTELDRVVKAGFKGIQIGSSVNGKNLDEKEFWPFYKKVQDLDLPVFVHPRGVAGVEKMKRYHLSNLIGNPMGTALGIASLIFGGVLRDFPRLKFAFAHAGGASPFIVGRWDHGYQFVEACHTNPKPPSEYLKMMYFDTVAFSDLAISYLVKLVGADHVIIGSDYPFDMAEMDPVAAINNAAGITKKDKEKILEHSTAEFLKI